MGNNTILKMIDLINRLDRCDKETRQKILSNLSEEEMAVLRDLHDNRMLNYLMDKDDNNQREAINGFDREDTIRLLKKVIDKMAEIILCFAESRIGSELFQNGITPEIVEYLNSLSFEEIDEDYGGDDQGAFTLRMDAPKVLRIYTTLQEKLGRALSESLSFQAREYKMALERLREARYAEMIEEYGEVSEEEIKHAPVLSPRRRGRGRG